LAGGWGYSLFSGLPKYMTSLRGESVCLIFKVNVCHPQNNIPSSNSVCFLAGTSKQASNVFKKLVVHLKVHENKIKS
jgi:hypothetical protein